ncbi:putative BTB/POZ domain, FYVE zinc finger, Zinc finger, FYVE/PHD-type, PDZ superfamily [Plasmopara halstedii]
MMEDDSNGDTLMSDLLHVNNLFASTYLSDVLFVLSSDVDRLPTSTRAIYDKSSDGDHLIPAHRLVLSLRSGAFRMALLRVKSSQVPGHVCFPLKIYVKDTSYRIFYSLLRFLYTNKLESDKDSDQQSQEEFWSHLLRAAYVYVVPSLVNICVKKMANILERKNGKVTKTENTKAITQQHLQPNTLDMLIFLDTILATDPSSVRQREQVDTSSSWTCDVMLTQCTKAVQDLETLCLRQLQHMEEFAFADLLQSDTGQQCSTLRLCEILRLRSDTPLNTAIRYQLGRVVHELLRLGEPLNRIGMNETDLPLVVALQTGNNAIIRRLLVNEDAPYYLLTDKIPLLFLASASGNVQHCEILIERNAGEVNHILQLRDGDKEIAAEFGHHQTPLHIASRKGHSAVVKLLLQHKAASNLPDEDGNTALHYASNVATVQVLLDRTFRTNPNIPNNRGRTPLHVAAANGNVSVVSYLIRHDAEQELVDDQGQNAFHHAAANGHTEVMLVLLHASSEKTMRNQVHVAVPSKTNIHNTTRDDNVQEVEQHETSKFEDSEIVQDSNEFDINREDLKGNTAFHLAAMSPSDRCQKTLQVLLENNADPNRTNWFGYTPLHLFCSHQHGPASLVPSFIEHGANIHVQSLDGSTALHLAVGRGSEEVAVALVSAGAFVHFLDAAGRSVVDLVESTNQGALLVPVLRNLSQFPDSIGDDQTTECSACHATFRLAMRKHYCRHCGRTVCYNCSRNKIAIPKFQVLKPDRVCDTCYDVLTFRKTRISRAASMAKTRVGTQALSARNTPLQASHTSDSIVIFASLVGATLRCVVHPQWPCEALLVAAADAYLAAFPQTEIPECNVVYHCQKQEMLVAGMPISESCASGDKVELGLTLPLNGNSQKDTIVSTTSRVYDVARQGELSEFCVLFHKLPLGFTMKRGLESTTEVGTIYPKSAATHFPRLAPGVTIVSIAGIQIENKGLRQVHEVIKNAELPLRICFRGPKLLQSFVRSSKVLQTMTSQCQERQCKESTDTRSVRSNGSSGSSSRKGRARKKREDFNKENQQRKSKDCMSETPELHDNTHELYVSNDSDDLQTDSITEAHLIRQIEQLKVQLLCKHEEAKQIARQLETCSAQLLVLRGDSSNVVPVEVHETTTPRSRREAPPSSHNFSKVRLTSKVLEAMDEKAGLPRRGTGAYTSSNVSSVSGYSSQSMPVVRSTSERTRSVRAVTHAIGDTMSTSSYTLKSSIVSARRNHSPRGTALRNLNKRYNYMPPKYATSTMGVAETGSSSLSSRGAVISRARNSRNPFLTRSESPGVGYYDVQVKDRVLGGEIGDSDRSLAWS